MTTHDRQDENLPTDADVGALREWALPSGAEVVEFYGTFLGVGTSRQSIHWHPLSRSADVEERCRACRWFEPRIFREENGRRRYLLHRTGRSVVPGEVTLTSHEWCLTPHELVKVLTTRPRSGPPRLTQPASAVLERAA